MRELYLPFLLIEVNTLYPRDGIGSIKYEQQLSALNRLSDERKRLG